MPEELIAVEKLIQEGNFGVDLIQISQIDIESSELLKSTKYVIENAISGVRKICAKAIIVNHNLVLNGPLPELLPITSGHYFKPQRLPFIIAKKVLFEQVCDFANN